MDYIVAPCRTGVPVGPKLAALPPRTPLLGSPLPSRFRERETVDADSTTEQLQVRVVRSRLSEMAGNPDEPRLTVDSRHRESSRPERAVAAGISEQRADLSSVDEPGLPLSRTWVYQA